MRKRDRHVLVAQLAADFPLFARSTIDRWLAREAARYEGTPAPDGECRAGRAVRTTLEELSREDVATSRELPLTPSAGTPDRTETHEPA